METTQSMETYSDFGQSFQNSSENMTIADARDEQLAVFEIATLGSLFVLILVGNSCVLVALLMRKIKMNRDVLLSAASDNRRLFGCLLQCLTSAYLGHNLSLLWRKHVVQSDQILADIGSVSVIVCTGDDLSRPAIKPSVTR